MKVRLYLDEDAQDNYLILALRLRGVDVVGAWRAGMRQRDDADHLLWATSQGQSLYSFNASDFCRLHRDFLREGRPHAGIIISQQQQFSVGEQLRRLLKLIATLSAEGMRNQLEFLSDWG